MSAFSPELTELLLKTCQTAHPEAWYPAKAPLQSGPSAEDVDRVLNDLRLHGLVELTDWKIGMGQGYRITPLGIEIADNPLFLKKLREGEVPALPASDEPNTPTPNAPNYFQQGEEARKGFYFPRMGPIVPLLIIANVLMFFVYFGVALWNGVPLNKAIGGDAATLHKLGSASADGIARGEYWRLLTSAFLHAGPIHLFMNMLALFMFRPIEGIWGSRRYLLIYLISSLCSSCLAIYLEPGTPERPVGMVGASGAICGIFASGAIWLYLNRHHLNPQDYQARATSMAINFALMLGISLVPGVSLGGHLGGALGGLLLGIFMRAHMISMPARRSFAGIQIALLPTLSMLLLAGAMAKDPRLSPFADSESKRQNHLARVEMLKVIDPILKKWNDVVEKTAVNRSTPPENRSPIWREHQEEARQISQEIPSQVAKLRSIKLAPEQEPIREEAIELLNGVAELARLLAGDPENKAAFQITMNKINEITQRWEGKENPMR